MRGLFGIFFHDEPDFFRFFRLHCNREVCYTEIIEAVTRYSIHNGALAQLGERYTGSVEVSGSIPLCSTIKRP